MKSRIFLVDSENISDYSFIKKNNVSCNDEVIIFASKASKSIKMECLEQVINSKAKITFEWVETGSKNELDFQLIAHLGMFLDVNKAHYIVSGDSGFVSAITHIKKKNPNALIEIIKGNQKIKNNSLKNSVGSKSEVDMSKEIDKILEILKSDKIKKKIKKVIQSWISGKQTRDQANKKISNELRIFGIHGRLNTDICQQITKSTKQLIDNKTITKNH